MRCPQERLIPECADAPTKLVPVREALSTWSFKGLVYNVSIFRVNADKS